MLKHRRILDSLVVYDPVAILHQPALRLQFDQIQHRCFLTTLQILTHDQLKSSPNHTAREFHDQLNRPVYRLNTFEFGGIALSQTDIHYHHRLFPDTS